MSRRRTLLVAASVAAAAVGGGALLLERGQGEDEFATDATVSSYAGPLDADGRYGAAGRALDCDDDLVGSQAPAGVYQNGATSDDPQAAVRTAYSEGLFLAAPRVDLGVAARSSDRQLLTYEAEGRTLMALLLRDGPATEGAGGPGWYVEAFARCDVAEFPAEVAREMGYLVWQDRRGRPVPVVDVHSAPGPEHCDWQRMTFLHVGEGRRARSYVEAPENELLPYVAGPYRTGVDLPDDATDTGWERDGEHLWLSADGDYAYVGSSDAVAAWPRFETACA